MDSPGNSKPSKDGACGTRYREQESSLVQVCVCMAAVGWLVQTVSRRLLIALLERLGARLLKTVSYYTLYDLEWTGIYIHVLYIYVMYA